MTNHGCGDCEYCDIPAGLKGIWSQNETLNYWIPATEDENNRFFDEGLVLGEVELPYVVLTELGVSGSSQSLGAGSNLDVKSYQIKIYGASRRFLREISKELRATYGNSCCFESCEGSTCGIRVFPGVYTKFGDGTRMIMHQLGLMLIDSF